MDRRQALLERARTKGVNPLLYWLIRAVLQPFCHVYFRMSRIGREHLPAEGPMIIAANHRSFLDPFVIAMLARRPIYFVAKRELFANRFVAWLLNSLGAFPIDRGTGDADALETARAILERGDGVLIFPEGTRIRPGGLGVPRRGVGRLALETGAPVVPVAVFGTQDVRRGWRFRPHKVRLRAGRPLRFPKVEQPSPALAMAVTERIWPCVELQWEWLGGLPPLRRAAVIGAGSWGTALSVALARAGVDVELGTRTAEQRDGLAATRRNDRHLPGVVLPERVRVARAADLDLEHADLVCLAVPARELPAVVAAHGGRVRRQAALLVAAKGLVPPAGAPPTAYVADRVPARAVAALGGPAHPADAVAHGAALVVASADRDLLAQVRAVLARAGFDVETTPDVVGLELAGAAANAAVLAAATASVAGPNAAGAAAGRVFAEVDAYARRHGGRPETLAGLAGAGGLVATVVAGSQHDDGRTAEARDALPLLAQALRDHGVRAPTLAGLAAVVEGRDAAEDWARSLTAPTRPRHRRAA